MSSSTRRPLPNDHTSFSAPSVLAHCPWGTISLWPTAGLTAPNLIYIVGDESPPNPKPPNSAAQRSGSTRTTPGSATGSYAALPLLATASFRLDAGSDSNAAQRNDTVDRATSGRTLTPYHQRLTKSQYLSVNTVSPWIISPLLPHQCQPDDPNRAISDGSAKKNLVVRSVEAAT
jgi:hypothetical protein